jgi:hypothetical protein
VHDGFSDIVDTLKEDILMDDTSPTTPEEDMETSALDALSDWDRPGEGTSTTSIPGGEHTGTTTAGDSSGVPSRALVSTTTAPLPSNGKPRVILIGTTTEKTP